VRSYSRARIEVLASPTFIGDAVSVPVKTVWVVVRIDLELVAEVITVEIAAAPSAAPGGNLLVATVEPHTNGVDFVVVPTSCRATQAA
jgi:hypothetical protein